MSVPPDRLAVRTGDPNKIMGVNKKVFWVVVVLGLVLAYYIYRKSQNNANSLATTAAGTTPTDTTNGVTAADIGGTPADNSFATATDETALEEQIQQLQTSLAQLEEANGGNGGLPGPGGSNPSPERNPTGLRPVDISIPVSLSAGGTGTPLTSPIQGVGSPGGVRMPGGTQTQ